jgi:hypothetical protein
MSNASATRECETAAIRDLEPVELDAVGGGEQRMDVYHPNNGIQAFLRAFYRNGGL